MRLTAEHRRAIKMIREKHLPGVIDGLDAIEKGGQVTEDMIQAITYHIGFVQALALWLGMGITKATEQQEGQ